MSHCAPKAEGKLTSKKARPASAGLNTFDPIPPKNPFATMIAKAAPRTVIQIGVVGGKTSARRIPVTIAEQSLILIFCLVASWNRNSKRTQLAVETKIVTSAGIPKITIPLIQIGISEMITKIIMSDVESFFLKCGLEDK